MLNNNTSVSTGQKYIGDLEGGRTDYSGRRQRGRLQRNLLKISYETEGASTIQKEKSAISVLYNYIPCPLYSTEDTGYYSKAEAYIKKTTGQQR